jgi:hypothetical protein
MSSQQRQLERLSGKVERALAMKGTASEHQATILQTKKGERVILQRIGGNPFKDAETESLAGKHIDVEGYRLGEIFRYTKATETRETKGE